MKQQLAWLCGAALSVVAVDVTHAQEQLDAHALAAAGDATADEALGRTTGSFAWDGRLVLRTQATETVRLAGIDLMWPLTGERGFPLVLVPIGIVGYAPHIVGGARVYRIYDPSLPATFSGGAVDLEPGVLPLVPTLELALGAGMHTSTTFQDGWSYDGGDLDWLSFDDGARALPDSVPSVGVIGRPADAELLASGPDFSGVWEAQSSTPPPDLAFAARAGDRYMLGFGALSIHAAVHLRNAWRSRDEIGRDVVMTPEPVAAGRADVEQTVRNASLAAALRLRLEYGGGHALEAHTWLVRTGEDRVRVNLQAQDPLTGFEELTTTDLRWREQQVLTQQVRGEQLLGSAGAPVLAWHYALTLASDEEPDRRSHAVRLGFPDQPLDASRRFTERDELSHDLGAELRVPLIASEASALHLSTGALAQFRNATYEQRNFTWRATGDGDAASVDELFAPDRAGEAWEPDEFPGVALDSTGRTLAGYALIDGRAGVFSAQGGARVEHERLEVEPRNLAAEPGLDFDDLHIAPSAHIEVRPIPMLALHTAWSLTVDRPRALEIYPSFVLGEGPVFIVGNPDLKASRQHNLELGLRFIAEPAQALGADGIGLTLVHKRIADPIRMVVVPNGDRSLVNGEHSQLWWLEAQADKHFGFMAPWLSDVYASCGAAFPLSSNEVLGTESTFNTDSFPSIDVPDYIATLRVAYDPARRGGKQGAILALDFQSVGERATAYSALGFDETISALHSLDLLASYPLGFGFAIGLSARNLLDARVERRVGDQPAASYRLGRSLMLGVSFREPS